MFQHNSISVAELVAEGKIEGGLGGEWGWIVKKNPLRTDIGAKWALDLGWGGLIGLFEGKRG